MNARRRPARCTASATCRSTCCCAGRATTASPRAPSSASATGRAALAGLAARAGGRARDAGPPRARAAHRRRHRGASVGELAAGVAGRVSADGPALRACRRRRQASPADGDSGAACPRRCSDRSPGFELRGSFDWRASFDLDLAQPDSVRFHADVIPHGLALDPVDSRPSLGALGGTVHRADPPAARSHRHARAVAARIRTFARSTASARYLRDARAHQRGRRLLAAPRLQHRGDRRSRSRPTCARARTSAARARSPCSSRATCGSATSARCRARRRRWRWPGCSSTRAGLSKERLLEIYLNIIEWGPDVHGADEAARYYFDEDAAQLTLPEALFLTIVVPSPAKWRWRFAPDGTLRPFARAQMHFIANKMASKGWLDPAEVPPADSLRRDASRARRVCCSPLPTPWPWPTASRRRATEVRPAGSREHAGAILGARRRTLRRHSPARIPDTMRDLSPAAIALVLLVAPMARAGETGARLIGTMCVCAPPTWAGALVVRMSADATLAGGFAMPESLLSTSPTYFNYCTSKNPAICGTWNDGLYLDGVAIDFPQRTDCEWATKDFPELNRAPTFVRGGRHEVVALADVNWNVATDYAFRPSPVVERLTWSPAQLPAKIRRCLRHAAARPGRTPWRRIAIPAAQRRLSTRSPGGRRVGRRRVRDGFREQRGPGALYRRLAGQHDRIQCRGHAIAAARGLDGFRRRKRNRGTGKRVPGGDARRRRSDHGLFAGVGRCQRPA